MGSQKLIFKPQLLNIKNAGSPMNARNIPINAYRFGFNGAEKDDEIAGAGNDYDLGERFYDARLGKMLSLDPLMRKYPFWSPYSYAGNSPISIVDVNGEGIDDPPKAKGDAPKAEQGCDLDEKAMPVNNSVYPRTIGNNGNAIDAINNPSKYPNREDVQHGTNGVCKTAAGQDLVNHLCNKDKSFCATDEGLLDNLKNGLAVLANNDEVDYVVEHFKSGNGRPLYHDACKLNRSMGYCLGYQALYENVVAEIEEAIKNGNPYLTWFSISQNALKKPSCETSIIRSPTAAAIVGGTQQVKVILHGITREQIGEQWYSNVTFEIQVIDVFGVSESDITSTANSFASTALASFWILQQQRNYKPFLNIMSYTYTMRFNED